MSKMKLWCKLSTMKWCFGLMLLMLINFQIIFFLMRSYDSKMDIDDTLFSMGTKANNILNYKVDSSNLPCFSNDYTEFLLGSMIERNFEGSQLHITSFFLSHSMLEIRDHSALNIHPQALDEWKKATLNFEGVKYSSTGSRVNHKNYYCRISNTKKSPSYLVYGEFLPNKLTPDSNSNRRYDVFRCAMQEKDIPFLYLITTNRTVTVEILRGDQSLLRFTIPWNLRKAGYLLSSPQSLTTSKYNTWINFGNETQSSHQPIINLCVPGFRKPPIRNNLPQFLEFMEYHSLIGINHVFLATTYSWESINMARILNIYRYYIENRFLTISSQAGDGIDYVMSTKGMSWDRISVKVLFINTCLYLSKGVSDYVGIWDLDEFFIPKLPYNNIIDVLKAVDSPDEAYYKSKNINYPAADRWTAGFGLAGGDLHPFCYLSTTVMIMGHKDSKPLTDIWIGSYFNHGPGDLKRGTAKKAILPTRTIFQGGLTSSGACKLPSTWTGCTEKEEFCYLQNLIKKGIINGSVTESSAAVLHAFDDIVYEKDVKRIDPSELAVIYHYMLNRMNIISSPSAIRSRNDYSDRFFTLVYNNIHSKKLHNISQELPKAIILPSAVDEKWVAFKTIYDDLKSEKVKYSIPVSESLPSFASDGTELVLGAIIERVHDSFDLFLTSFLLCHQVLKPQPYDYGPVRIHPASVNTWKSVMVAFEDVMYEPSGVRSHYPRFYCRISNTESNDSVVYLVQGEFIPNTGTTDANANNRLDILRCKMSMTKYGYLYLSSSTANVRVELLRESFSLLNFTVPWRTRRTGYMLSSPNEASTFDAWSGYNVSSSRSIARIKPGTTGDVIHMCVPGLESPPSKASLPLYLEFVQHHLLLGVSHMFLVNAFSWDSKHMDNFLQVFRSYIDEGSVSVASHAADGIDNVYSIKGLSWDRDNVKVFQVNMCLYLSKGVSDYVGIWDLDEFFIPRSPHFTMIDVIKAVESPTDITTISNLSQSMEDWKGGRGLADGDGHPYCYLLLSSRVMLHKVKNAQFNQAQPWIGEVFAHGPEPKSSVMHRRIGFQKSILPTKTIFQAGLHVAGACRLAEPWTGCEDGVSEFKEFCYTDSSPLSRYSTLKVRSDGSKYSFHKDHKFDEKVLQEDAKVINADTEAAIYHIQIHRSFLDPASPDALATVNEYTAIYFPAVMEQLRRRGLSLVVSLPSSSDQPITLSSNQKKSKLRVGVSSTEGLNSTNWSLEQILPSLSIDRTSLILSAIIERKSESRDLYLTSFLLRQPITSSTATTRIEEDESTTIYYCRITNFEGSIEYEVEGQFIRITGTSDVDSNNRLDILRCKMRNTEYGYRHLARSIANVSVELLRESFSLLNFTVPWRTRRTGYMLSSPNEASAFDAWSVSGDENDDGKGGEGDVIHMCVPGLESPPSTTTLPLYMEFVQHHLLLGVSHMFLVNAFSWDSKHMDNFLQSFRSYIDEGRVSVASHTSEFEQLSLPVTKVFQVNMCLYLSKGVSDYVGIWDLDEFFIPKLPFNSILDVIKAIEIPKVSSTFNLGLFTATKNENKEIFIERRGLADGDSHPFCLMQLSKALLQNDIKNSIDNNIRWIGESFQRGTEGILSPQSSLNTMAGTIIPTRVMFQLGLEGSGGCRLEPQWTGCTNNEDFCFTSNVGMKDHQLDSASAIHHTFDEPVLLKDVKTINPSEVAVIYKYQQQSTSLDINKRLIDGSTKSENNEYNTRFFQPVMEELTRRGLRLAVLLPVDVKRVPPADETWLKFKNVYEDRRKPNPGLTKGDGTIGTVIAAPKDYSVSLPTFVIDESDFIFGSVIERSFDSWQLYITTIFLGHQMLFKVLNDFGLHRIRPKDADIWRRAMVKWEKTVLSATGVRDPPKKFYCRISNSKGSESYLSEGEFIPNRLTPDANTNRRLDILRCKLQNSEAAYRHLARSAEVVHVEILRERFSLINFTIPWATRKAGFPLTTPESAHANTYDSWTGYRQNATSPPSTADGDMLHICAPGFEDYPSQTTLPLPLEYIQYHVLAGTSHVSIGAVFGWESPHMQIILQSFRSFIKDGMASVVSLAGDGIDRVYSLKGSSWYRDNFKILHITSYLYFGKGMFSYCGVWDLDEFFIPKPPYKNIIQLIQSLTVNKKMKPFPARTDPGVIQSSWKGGPGLADGDGHPLCYLLLASETILNKRKKYTNEIWMGDRFSHGPEYKGSYTHKMYAYKKSILPTKSIFYVGLHMSGACKVDPAWTGCGSDFTDNCYSKSLQERGVSRSATKGLINFRLYHRFDEGVMDEDAKAVNPDTEGSVYHMQPHRLDWTNNRTLLNMSNVYSQHYFPSVRQELRRRSLDLLVSLPATVSIDSLPTSWEWSKYDEIYEFRKDVLNKYYSANNKVIDVVHIDIPTSSSTSVSKAIHWNSKANTIRTRSASFVSTNLPSLAEDLSEVILSSLIERKLNSFDLYLTTFLLCHQIMTPNSGTKGSWPIRIAPGMESNWKHVMVKFEKTKYTLEGVRDDGFKYYCRLWNSEDDTVSYLVPGEFIPNAGSIDNNANRKLDVLRCKMENTEKAYKNLARSTASVRVELLRESFSLLNFTVPWRTRRTGYMLSSPNEASTFDAWSGYNVSSSSSSVDAKPGTTGDVIHMCVPGLESPPSKASLPLYMEFVQHHLLLGVSHMFLVNAFSWDSKHMDNFLQSFRSYIDEGSVSVASHAADGIDNVYSIKGLVLDRDNIKIFHVNMCLYLSKGVSDYVGIWDLDEFFIPKLPYNSIIEVLKSVRASGVILPFSSLLYNGNISQLLDVWKGGRGFADNDGHPYCQLLLSSRVILSKNADAPLDLQNQWLGESYSHGLEPLHSKEQSQMGFQKSILPTNTMYQAGLHIGGGCRLNAEWTGCRKEKEFCYLKDALRDTTKKRGDNSVATTHAFDDIVMEKDVKKFHTEREAVIYHYLINRNIGHGASPSALTNKNEYTTRFLPKVIKQLRERGLELVVRLPRITMTTTTSDNKMNTHDWIPREELYKSRLDNPKTKVK